VDAAADTKKEDKQFLEMIMQHFYVVLDFEATCERDVRPRGYRGDGSKQDRLLARDQEIIELPSVLVTETGEFLSPPAFGMPPSGPGEFQRYIQPSKGPLSAFCTELTKITQSDVDGGAPDFSTALYEYESWLRATGMLRGTDGASFTIVTCGD